MHISGQWNRSARVATATSLLAVFLFLGTHGPVSGQGPEVLAIVVEVAMAIKKEQEEAARWKKVDDILEHVENISRRLSRIETTLQLLLDHVRRISEKIDQRFDRERHEKILAEMGRIRRNLRLWALDPVRYRHEIESALGALQAAVEFSRLTASYGGYLYVAAAMPYERAMFILLDRELVAWEDTFNSYADYFDQSRNVDEEGSIGAAYRATRLRMLFVEMEHASNSSGWCRIDKKLSECNQSNLYEYEYYVLRRWSGSLEQGYDWHKEEKKDDKTGRRVGRCDGYEGGPKGGGHHFVAAPGPEKDLGSMGEHFVNSQVPPDWKSENYWRKADDQPPAFPRHSCFKPLETTRVEYRELTRTTVPLLEDALNTAYNAEALARAWARGPS